MAKSAAERLTDTVTFIRGYATLDQAQRTRAAELVEKFIAASGAAAAAMSASLHIGESGADPQQLRECRRAYVLLHKALTRESPAAVHGFPPAVISIQGANARGYLPDLVKAAAIARDRQTLSSYMMAAALREMEQNPLNFLQNNKLFIAGSSKRDLTQGNRNVMPFCLTFNFDHKRYEFRPTADAGGVMLNVDSVTARWWTDIPGAYVKNGNTAHGNFSQLSGIELCSRLMVTTQFTGCAFAMKRANGHMYCSHTTPRPPMSDFNDAVRPMTGTQLARELHSLNGVAGDFANVPGGNALAIYGAGQSYGTLGNVSYPSGLGGGDSYMTIIGAPSGPDYAIYSQVTQNRVMTSAQRIF